MLSCELQVTVVTPHMPGRANELVRALLSVELQQHRATDVSVAVDVYREGSAATRNRALRRVETDWVAFLDDDDWWFPEHLSVLTAAAVEHDATVVYSGCQVFDRNLNVIPLREEWGRFGHDFDPALLRRKSYIPVTSLVRTSLAKRALFGAPAGSDYDDWGFYLRLLDMGARFHHVPQVTWGWHHHGANTSGRSDRW